MQSQFAGLLADISPFFFDDPNARAPLTFFFGTIIRFRR